MAPTYKKYVCLENDDDDFKGWRVEEVVGRGDKKG